MTRRQGIGPGAGSGRTILIVAREAATRAALVHAFRPAGYAVELAEGLGRARDVIAATRVDLGLVVAEAADEIEPELFRAVEDRAGLLVAAQDPAVLAQLRRFDDGRLVSSIDPVAIAARVGEVLQAGMAAAAEQPETLQFEGFTLDLSGHGLTDAQGRDVPLTPTEFSMLVSLARAPGRVLSRDQLRASLGGGRESEAYDRSIDIMVSRLRRKIEDDPKAPRLILTVAGAGYKFAARRSRHVPQRDAPNASRSAPVNGNDAVRLETIAAERPAERRQLTILACEFFGAAALSLRLDAEEFHAVLEAHQQRCREIVEAHHGRVATSLADGLIAYFGDPRAQGNDAEHAVHAGLALIGLCRPDAAAPGFQVRVGIASGSVVMHPLAAGAAMAERSAVGEAPNLAQRLRSAAEPGTVVIAESTRDLVRGLFAYRALAGVPLDGHPQPVPAWHVVGVSAIDSRFEARRIKDAEPRVGPSAKRIDLTPFVGRSEELRALTNLAGEAAARLTAIDIHGEPGVGKSRLLHELRGLLMQRNVFVLSGNCWPDSQETAFRPFIEVVRRAFRLIATDSEADIARKLERTLGILGLAGGENVALLMNLLGLNAMLAGMDGALVGRRTRELLFQLMQQRGRVGPFALLLEDLHWIDHASQELLARFIESQTALPLLIVATSRPEFVPPWAGRPGATALRLEPLAMGDTARLVETRLQPWSEATPLVPLIVRRAEGNPLFAEEIANFLIDRIERSGSAPSHQALATELVAAIPASVQTLLVARVDRLAQSDRTVLQAASAIGRRFELDVLSAVTGAGPELPARLSAMEALDLVRRDAKGGDFVFKHALVRDALYASLLGPARGDLHLKIAREIERRAGAGLTEVAEILAYHYAQTGAVDKAIAFLALAGRKSFDIYSVDEAEGFLRQALNLARAAHPDALDDRSVDIMVDLVRVLTVQTKTRDIIALTEPLQEAIEQRADHSRVAILLYFYGVALFTAWRFRDGHRIQQRALALAGQHGDPKTKAYAIAGVVFLSTVIEPLSLDRLRTLADEAFAAAEDGADVYLFATVSMSVAWNYSNRGLLNDGREWTQRLLRFGRERRDSRSVGIALWMSGWLDIMAEDFASALHHGQECTATASTQIDRIMGSMVTATAQISTGAVTEGLALMRRARAEIEANSWTFLFVATDGPLGLGMMLSGRFGAGLAWLRAFVARVEAERPVAGTDFVRLSLAQVYVAIACDGRCPSWRTLLHNLLPILWTRLFGLREAERLLTLARRNPMFDPDGVLMAKVEFGLGRTALARKHVAAARAHLERAQAIARTQNATILLTRIEGILSGI